MRPRSRFAAGVLAAMLGLGLAPAASAAPDGQGFQGERRGNRGVDQREGRHEPSAVQRVLAARSGWRVRFNRHGTPAIVATPREALATGLPRDPEAAARVFLRDNRVLFGLSAGAVARLELVSVAPLGDGASVLLRQRFGRLRSGLDGLVAVGVRDGAAWFASSSLSRHEGEPGTVRLPARAAVAAAAVDAGRRVTRDDVEPRGRRGERDVFRVDGLSRLAYARLVAVAAPADGVRAAWEVVLVDEMPAEPLGFRSFVDAADGRIVAREDLVDYLSDNARFDVFANVPPLDYGSTDTRELWCWRLLAGCARGLASDASPAEWDLDPVSGTATGRSEGNNARSTEKWNSNDTRKLGKGYTIAPEREFRFAWTNQWQGERCNPDTTFTSPQRNDIDAAAVNLFAMHNRMHDWSYRLGFTEATWNLQQHNFDGGGGGGDPEHGNVQAGGIVGGPPSYASRDNANQITPPDGQSPITNMYLWQPIAAGFYAPCVDGDFDMSVIGHEYTHAISNRMVAGPDERLRGLQANAMGESWSDLVAVEYLAEHGFAPQSGENPFAVGPYVTGDRQAGIRNYAMSRSPLNYSNIGYDVVGPQVHADGEIWSAVNYDIRAALSAAHGTGTRASQEACAAGATPVGSCPGNRRWMQLVFDAWLLMATGDVSMLDARDALLAADQVRFGGANQAALWDAFAGRGLGEDAASASADDSDPTASFRSPHSEEGTLVLRPLDDRGRALAARLFIGRYEARSVPMADSDAATALSDTVELVAGRYDLRVQAPGHGTAQFAVDVRPGEQRAIALVLPRNLAAASAGASASGDGLNVGKLVDETEATNWAVLHQPVAGRQVTVRLAPRQAAAFVRRIQVSAMLRPRDAVDPGGDTGTQNRFSALRSFELLACDASSGADCDSDTGYRVAFRSPAAAFPSVAPRPRAPDLALRSFDVRSTRATHVRLRVLTNQCTGAPAYAGDQDDDARHVTDCAEGSTQDETVRVAELQVFER